MLPDCRSKGAAALRPIADARIEHRERQSRVDLRRLLLCFVGKSGCVLIAWNATVVSSRVVSMPLCSVRTNGTRPEPTLAPSTKAKPTAGGRTPLAAKFKVQAIATKG